MFRKRRKLKVVIKDPCAENWNEMTPVDRGRFCDSCAKNVVDFSTKSSAEIVRIITSEKNLCGRFRADQIEKVYQVPRSDMELRPIAWFFAALSFLQTDQTQAFEREKVIEKPITTAKTGTSEKSIFGNIRDSAGLPIADAIINIDDLGSFNSNENGEFQIVLKDHIAKEVVLKISKPGYQFKEIHLNWADFESVPVEITLELENHKMPICTKDSGNNNITNPSYIRGDFEIIMGDTVPDFIDVEPNSKNRPTTEQYEKQRKRYYEKIKQFYENNDLESE